MRDTLNPLDGIQLDPFGGTWVQQALQGATQSFVAFTLVVTRLSGLAAIGPVFGHPDVPVQFRVWLVVGLSLVLTPALTGSDHARTFARLDGNQDGLVTLSEMPPSMQAQGEILLRRADKTADDGLTEFEFQLGLPVPHSALEYAWLALVEFAVGIALGLGVMTILSGLQMAGMLIDQQVGVSLGEVFNPEFQTNASLSGQLLHQLGLAVFLIVGGHVLLVSALMDTFQSLPVGYAHVSASAFDLLRDLVHHSLALSLQVSAPVMATMAVVGLAMGYLGHTIPQINVLVIGFPIRTFVGLIVLGMAIAGIAQVMARSLPETVEMLRGVLGGG